MNQSTNYAVSYEFIVLMALAVIVVSICIYLFIRKSR